MLQSWDDDKQGPIDPFAIAEPEIDSISERLRQSLLTDIPALGKAAEYFFQVYQHSLDKSWINRTQDSTCNLVVYLHNAMQRCISDTQIWRSYKVMLV